MVDRGTQASASVAAAHVSTGCQTPVPVVSRVLTPVAGVVLEGAGQLALGGGGRLGGRGAGRGRMACPGGQLDVVQGYVG